MPTHRLGADAAGTPVGAPARDLPEWAGELIDSAHASGEDIAAALAACAEFGSRLPLPAHGSTGERLRVLTELARVNLTVARVFEAHTDALSILAEAGQDPDPGSDRTWGVFAAEAPGARLDATVSGADAVLTGIKPWCSLGGMLDAALVTAHTGSQRQLFRVDLRHAGVRAEAPAGWVARGLRTVSSGPVHFAGVPARPVGELGWYLRRPGFAWGGIGVAACWHGGALGLADTLARAAGQRTGELNALHVGIVDAALHASDAVLCSAAEQIDHGSVDGELIALRVRAVVAAATERVLRQSGHALGPGPLAFDEDHARRVADLELYLRQHHGERDLAALGTRLLPGR